MALESLCDLGWDSDEAVQEPKIQNILFTFYIYRYNVYSACLTHIIVVVNNTRISIKIVTNFVPSIIIRLLCVKCKKYTSLYNCIII